MFEERRTLHGLSRKVERHRNAGSDRTIAGHTGDREIKLVGKAERLDQHDELLRTCKRTVRDRLRTDPRLEMVGRAVRERDDRLEHQAEMAAPNRTPETAGPSSGPTHVAREPATQPDLCKACGAVAGKHVQCLPKRRAACVGVNPSTVNGR